MPDINLDVEPSAAADACAVRIKHCAFAVADVTILKLLDYLALQCALEALLQRRGL